MGFLTNMFGVDEAEEKIFHTISEIGPAGLELIADTFREEYPHLVLSSSRVRKREGLYPTYEVVK